MIRQEKESTLEMINDLLIPSFSTLSEQRARTLLARHAGAYTAFLQEPLGTFREEMLRLRVESGRRIFEIKGLELISELVELHIYRDYRRSIGQPLFLETTLQNKN